MNGRMAVIAAIVSWFARGASPVDGMYWFDSKTTRTDRQRQQRAVETAGAIGRGRYAHCG